MWSSWILYYLEKWASRTSKHLFSRPFFSYSRIPQAYSRTPQVRCQAAGDQACSWYFIGTFWLRETVAFEMMRQLLSLGRTGFILLTCSPQNGDLVSQVRFTSVLLFWDKMGINPPEPAAQAGVVGWSVLGGLVFSHHLVRLLVKRPLKLQGVGRYLFKPTRASFVCVQLLRAWFVLLLHQRIFVMNSERRGLYMMKISVLGTWKGVDHLWDI